MLARQVWGDDGDDIIELYFSNSRTVVHGGNGNDIINLHNGKSAKLYGDDGDDTFNLMSTHTGVTIDGGSGTNIVNGNVGSNTTINVVGANSGVISLVKNVEQTVNIGGIDYRVSTTSNTAELIYKQNASGQIEFTRQSGYITIKGDENKQHNVKLSGVTFYGGNCGDNIYAYDTQVYTGSGNNIITVNSATLYAEKGNNTINAAGYSRIYTGGLGINNIELNTNCNYIESHGNTTINFKSNCFYNTIYGTGEGNSITSSIPIPQSNSIYGFGAADNMEACVALNPNETKEVEINNSTYTIKNKGYFSNALLYSIDPITNMLSFGARNVSITAPKDTQQNVTLSGHDNSFYGSDHGDAIELRGSSITIDCGAGDDHVTEIESLNSSVINGNDGDDTIILNCGGTLYGGSTVYGGNGNDTITVNIDTGNVINGGEGDDTYNVNAVATNLSDSGGNNVYNINTNGVIVNGGPGDDTFYIRGNNNNVRGAGGDDYFVIDGENNTIDGGSGNNYHVNNSSTTGFMNAEVDPNSGMLNFATNGETKEFTMDGKTYTVKNNASANILKYSFNQNTKTITLNGDDFEITSDQNQANTINIRGNNLVYNGSNLVDKITVEQGSNNIINGLDGDDILISDSENNSLNGGNGKDKITLNASTNKEVTGGAGNDEILINSDNNTKIDAGSGNNKITVNGKNNSIDADNGNNNVTVNDESNLIKLGNGANNVKLLSDDNTLIAGNGNNVIGIKGDNNNVVAQKAVDDINIKGNNNEITLTRGDNNIIINGDGNTFSSTLGKKVVKINGDTNEVVTGSENDKFEVKGALNTVESTGGKNTFSIRGNSNTVQGGADVDDIKINGSNNIAKGGDSSDTFMISDGTGNQIDGEGGERNTMINNGKQTSFNNAVDITPRPFELDLKIDIGYDENSFLRTKISFNLFDFSVDFSTQEGALESIEKIDEMLTNVREQITSIGSVMNRIESVLEAQTVKINNLLSTRSTLRDADIAKESSQFIRYQILQQASATLMSTSRNLNSQNVLGLLQGLH